MTKPTSLVPLIVLLVACDSTTTAIVQPTCEDDIEAPVIELPPQCYEADWCTMTDAPWEDTCGRAYVCPLEDQESGDIRDVCVRARHCECLEAWDACGTDEVEFPSVCAPSGYSDPECTVAAEEPSYVLDPGGYCVAVSE